MNHAKNLDDAIESVATLVSNAPVSYGTLYDLRENIEIARADANNEYLDPQFGVLVDCLTKAIQNRNYPPR